MPDQSETQKPRKRWAAHSKNALMLVLFVSACLLALKSGAFGEIAVSTEQQSPAPSFGTNVLAPAMYPDAMSVSIADVGRFTAIYNGEESAMLWNRIRDTLGEALGTSDTGLPVSESEFRAALTAPDSVYISFRSPVPSGILVKWLDVTAVREHTELVTILCLTTRVSRGENARELLSPELLPDDGQSDDYLCIYYLDVYGNFYRSETATAAASLFTTLADCEPNSFFFAFERAKNENGFDSSITNVEPYELLPELAPELPVLVASNPFTVETPTREILTAFGMNPFSRTSFREANVATVYMEEGIQLKVFDDGKIEFKREPVVKFSPEDVSVPIERVRSLLAELSGGDTLQLSSFEVTSTGANLTFDYVINGIEVKRVSHAATVTTSGDIITAVTLTLRAYTADGVVLLLPAEQAAAASPHGGKLKIIYTDNGGRIISPQWVVE